MRYAAEGIIVLGLVAFVIFLVWVCAVRPAQRVMRQRRLRHLDNEPWTVREHSDGVNTEFWLKHPTEKPIYIDEVSALLPAWQHQEELEELRVVAQQKADDKNRRLLS